jgi:hypothetical protein
MTGKAVKCGTNISFWVVYCGPQLGQADYFGFFFPPEILLGIGQLNPLYSTEGV